MFQVNDKYCKIIRNYKEYILCKVNRYLKVEK